MTIRNQSRPTSRMIALVAIALSLVTFGLVGCSSDSGSDDAKQGDSSGQTQDDGSTSDDGGSVDDEATGDASGDKDDLPSGWPDVPMPDYDEVTGGSSDDNYWNALLIVDPGMSASGDEMLSAYRSKLEAAGYSATDEDGSDSLSFSDGTYTIQAFSNSPGMLSVTVSNS